MWAATSSNGMSAFGEILPIRLGMPATDDHLKVDTRSVWASRVLAHPANASVAPGPMSRRAKARVAIRTRRTRPAEEERTYTHPLSGPLRSY